MAVAAGDPEAAGEPEAAADPLAPGAAVAIGGAYVQPAAPDAEVQAAAASRTRADMVRRRAMRA